MDELRGRRLTIVISSLQGGGAERVACILANAWGEAGVRVTVLTCEEESAVPAYHLAECVAYRKLGLNRPAGNKLGAIKEYARGVLALRRAIVRSQAEVVISFLGQINVMTLAACFGLGVPVLVSERCHPEYYEIGRGWGQCRRWLYPRAAELVVQTREIAKWCEERLGVKSVVIANPVQAPKPGHPGLHERKVVVAGGRLDPQKGFDLLIGAFAELADRFPEWDLVIYGKGDEGPALQEFIDKLGLGRRVTLAGWANDLASVFEGADVFALSSRFEGFPNVLCEAMASGLPVVAFDCPSGPADIVRDGVDGFLVSNGDVAEFGDRLARLMGDAGLRGSMGKEARKIVGRYSLDRFLEAWANVITPLLS